MVQVKENKTFNLSPEEATILFRMFDDELRPYVEHLRYNKENNSYFIVFDDDFSVNHFKDLFLNCYKWLSMYDTFDSDVKLVTTLLYLHYKIKNL